MEPFIRVDQYNFIKEQTKKLVLGFASSKDEAVLNTLKSLAIERVLALFQDMDEDKERLFQPITEIDEAEKAAKYLLDLKPYVIPFEVTEQEIKKLFSKVKKLKIPSLDDYDFKEIAYLGWTDHGSGKKYLVMRRGGKLTGLEGSFQPSSQKGICALCNRHEPVGMFLVKEKGKVQGTFTNRGNYICQDSDICNHNLTSLDKLYDFADRLKGKA